MALDYVIGKDCRLYYNTGTWTTPVWNLIEKVVDLSLGLTKNEADISCRQATYEHFGAGLKSVTLEFGYIHTVQRTSFTDTIFDALMSAFESDTIWEYAVMDGAIATSGSQGLRAYCALFGAPVEQGLKEGMRWQFTLRPTRFVEAPTTLREPDWWKVA